MTVQTHHLPQTQRTKNKLADNRALGYIRRQTFGIIHVEKNHKLHVIAPQSTLATKRINSIRKLWTKHAESTETHRNLLGFVGFLPTIANSAVGAH
jgi:hypothetical protein